jgi:hypothetical protein
MGDRGEVVSVKRGKHAHIAPRSDKRLRNRRGTRRRAKNPDIYRKDPPMVTRIAEGEYHLIDVQARRLAKFGHHNSFGNRRRALGKRVGDASRVQ